MMQTITPEQIAASKSYTDAFTALSQVAFSGVQRLALLNMNASRAALEDGLAASNSLLQGAKGRDLKTFEGVIGAPAAQRCAEYFRGVQEIALDSQQQAVRILSSYFTTLGFPAMGQVGSNAGLDMFSKFLKDSNSLFEANARAVGDATTEMMSKVTSPKVA